MLPLLGLLFYFAAAASLLFAFVGFKSSGPTTLDLVLGFGGAISSAFFGAMCFAADTALLLLKKIASKAAPPSGSQSLTDDVDLAEGPKEAAPSNTTLAVAIGTLVVLLLVAFN